MTTGKTRVWVAVLLAAAACGRHGGGGGDGAGGTIPPAADGGAGGTAAVPPEAEPALATVRLLGANAADYARVPVELGAVEIAVDGVPATVTGTVRSIDLANAAQAWRAGMFPMPAPDATVTVRIGFAPNASSWWKPDGSSGLLEPFLIRFTVPGAFFAPRGHAVVVLDVARSIALVPGAIGGGGGRAWLLPQLQVVN